MADSPRQSLTLTTAARAPLTQTSQLLTDYSEPASPKQDETEITPPGAPGCLSAAGPRQPVFQIILSRERDAQSSQGVGGWTGGVLQVRSRLESVFLEPQISNEVVSEIFPATPEIAEGEGDGMRGEPAYAEYCAPAPGGGLAGHPIQAHPPMSILAAPPRDSGPTPSEAGSGTPSWHFIWSLSI